MEPSVIINSKQFGLTIKRLCYQLIENHNDFSNTVLIGLQPRGIYLANRLKEELKEITGVDVLTGCLDITFYRDDFRRGSRSLVPSVTNIDFSLEGKRVVLIDDVLYTGRTVRAGMEACLAFGRPSEVELMTLVDRRFKRHLPVEPNYRGQSVDTFSDERVKVEWKEVEGKDQVVLFTQVEA